MLSVFSRPSQVYVDRGMVATLSVDGVMNTLAKTELGDEMAALQAYAGPALHENICLLLGPSYTRWQTVDRIGNIWRRTERESAVRALLSDTGALAIPQDQSIAVADPAPASRWVCLSTVASVLDLAGSPMAAGRAHVVSAESLVAVAASGIERRGGARHLIVMQGTCDVAWVIKSSSEVLDCGIWLGPLTVDELSEARNRLQLMHGIDRDACLLLALRSEFEPSITSNGEWLVKRSHATRCFRIVPEGNESQR